MNICRRIYEMRDRANVSKNLLSYELLYISEQLQTGIDSSIPQSLKEALFADKQSSENLIGEIKTYADTGSIYLV